MKRLTVPATAAVLLLGSAITSTAADHTAVRTEIEHQYARIRQAFKQKDVTILRSILAPEFAHIDAQPGKAHSKPIDRDHMLAGWQGWFKVQKSVESQSHTIKSLKVDRGHAIANVEWAIAFTEDHGTGGLRHATYRGLSHDTWVKTADGWKLLRLENVGLQTRPGRIEKRHQRRSHNELGSVGVARFVRLVSFAGVTPPNIIMAHEIQTLKAVEISWTGNSAVRQ